MSIPTEPPRGPPPSPELQALTLRVRFDEVGEGVELRFGAGAVGSANGVLRAVVGGRVGFVRVGWFAEVGGVKCTRNGQGLIEPWRKEKIALRIKLKLRELSSVPTYEVCSKQTVAAAKTEIIVNTFQSSL